MFEQVGLYTNLVNTNSMTFTSGFIWGDMVKDDYKRREASGGGGIHISGEESDMVKLRRVWRNNDSILPLTSHGEHPQEYFGRLSQKYLVQQGSHHQHHCFEQRHTAISGHL